MFLPHLLCQKKQKNKICYQELFGDVEAKGEWAVKTQDFGTGKIILLLHF